MSDHRRILSKLETLWDRQPAQHFGQLVEEVENVAWEQLIQRDFSPRLSNMGDDLFEAALDIQLAKTH